MEEQMLRLNPDTGYYEGTFTVQVEPEIFRRILFNYVEEHHIDLTDLVAWEKAVQEVARTAKWLTHPRATVVPLEVRREQIVEPSPANTDEDERKVPPTTKYLTEKDEEALWKKAHRLPFEQWETLLTSLPDELGSRDVRKRPFYVRRFAERKSLERLREQLQPVSQRVEALAEAMNGNRIH